MRIIMDLPTKNGKYLIIEVDNISFSNEKIALIYGDNIDKNGCTLYVFDIPDDGTEIYNYFSNQILEKGILDLRGYEYRMYDANTMEEIYDDNKE